MFFEKILKCQISWKFIRGNRIGLWGQTDRQTIGRTDRHDEAYNRFSQCYEHV